MSNIAAVAIAGVIMVALNFYVLFAGADFGGGVWDFFARGPRQKAQRDLISHALAPIWEANHVWLILVIVLLFTCFPAAFAAVAITLHVPLTLMLLGIVLRGSAFIFRSYGSDADATQQRWGRVFAIASIITPVLLGMCVGAIATGGIAQTAFAGSFTAHFISPWLTLFGFGVGLFALALFSFLAAVYLTIEAEGTELQEDFRARALWAAGAVFVIAFGVLALSWNGAPMVRKAIMGGPWALPFHSRHRNRGCECDRGAVDPPLSPRARRRRRAGDFHFVGMGRVAVSVRAPAHADDRRLRRAHAHARTRIMGAGGGRVRVVPVALLSLSDFQSGAAGLRAQEGCAGSEYFWMKRHKRI